MEQGIGAGAKVFTIAPASDLPLPSTGRGNEGEGWANPRRCHLDCGDSSPLLRRRLVAVEVPSASAPARPLALARDVNAPFRAHASVHSTATSRLTKAVTSHRTPQPSPIRVPSVFHPWLKIVALTSVVLAFLCARAPAAERFDDIVVSPQSFAADETTHGYFEHRFTIENQSAARTHTVELVLPERSATGWGDSITSIRRTATIGPRSTVTLSLWQPALPIHSSGAVGVNIGGRRRGTVVLPHGHRHASYGTSSGSPAPPIALVSRSLNTDDLEAALRGTPPAALTSTTAAPYSPEKATGAPDVPGNSVHANAWMPVASAGTHWLELDFPAAAGPTSIQIHQTLQYGAITDLILYGSKREELAVVTAPTTSKGYGRNTLTVTLPAVTNAVTTVRINLKTQSGRNYGIDAVRLNSATGGGFATAARANGSLHPGTFGASSTPKPATTPPPLKLLRAETEPAAWSEHWLAYTRFDAVILRDSDLATLPPAARDALTRYAEAGGTVAIFGHADPPATWRTFEIPNLRRFHVGFGYWLNVNAPDTRSLTSDQRRLLIDTANYSQIPWRAEHDAATANKDWPVVEDQGVPLRGLVAILLVFVILIGPVNVYVLSRRNRRIWLLWTIPAISAVTCLLVFGYSFISEGFTPSVRLEGVTLLDQNTHRATTLGRTAFYAPLTPGDGLRFSYDTEVTPFINKSGAPGSGRDLDFSQTQNLRSGWITARVPTHFLLRKSETRRERLDVEFAPDGTPTVVNGLGAEILTLTLADPKGRVWTGEKLAAGQKTRLASTTGSARGAVHALHFFNSWDWKANPEMAATDPHRFLRPGTYLAQLPTAPFLENGLGTKAPTRTRSAVYGLFATPPAAP